MNIEGFDSKETYRKTNDGAEEVDQLLNQALDELKEVSTTEVHATGSTMDELRAQAARQTDEFNGRLATFRSAYGKVILADKIVTFLENLNPFKK